MKNFVVEFTDQGARIHKGDISRFLGQPNVLVNPKLPPGVPPHLWRMDGDEIAVISPGPLKVLRKPLLKRYGKLLLAAIAGFLLGLLF